MHVMRAAGFFTPQYKRININSNPYLINETYSRLYVYLIQPLYLSSSSLIKFVYHKLFLWLIARGDIVHKAVADTKQQQHRTKTRTTKIMMNIKWPFKMHGIQFSPHFVHGPNEHHRTANERVQNAVRNANLTNLMLTGMDGARKRAIHAKTKV